MRTGDIVDIKHGVPANNQTCQGILNIHKPIGITTMDVVRRMKKASGQKRVGHGGTLDPLAGGVVTLCFGQATRMMEYLINSTKDYLATIELGSQTDTYDALGEITEIVDPSNVVLHDVEDALQSFEGTVMQVPPMFSALKKNGRRLYDLAREGLEVEREPRRVDVKNIELIEWTRPIVTVEISCGRGFYVRSFAHDLGQKLSCGGHLKSLTRLRTGPFKLSEALSLEDAVESFKDGLWRKVMHSIDVVASHMPSVVVGKRIETMIRNGQTIPRGIGIPFSKPDGECRVYTTEGAFLAIMSFNSSLRWWQPKRVFM